MFRVVWPTASGSTNAVNQSVSDTIEVRLDYEASGHRYLGLPLKAPAKEPKATVVLLPDWRGQSPFARDLAS